MKILCILLTAASLQISAKGFSQSITVSLKNAPLVDLFKVIEQQSNFSFVYSKEAIEQSKPVTIEVKNENLEKILKIVFANQPLSYSFNERFIVIKLSNQKKEVVSPFTYVRGRVVNENGEPIAGASVVIKGTVIGTSTDSNGEFNLDVPSPDMVLLITSVNTEPFEIRINARTDLGQISIKTSVKVLDAVIINKGYYTTTQRLNTGSVSKVTAEEIGKQPVANPIAALQGRLPGLLITQKNGLPGSSFSIQIRGQNSIQQGNDPLFIIDGVPFAPENLAKLGLAMNVSSPFITINPADIESIEILKDADATSIYGSRGANGVVLITTKKAIPGKTTVDVNFYAGWGKPTRTMDYMNTSQYLQMRREAFKNDGIIPTASDAPDLLLWDTTRYTDWKDLIIGNTANVVNAQIRLYGGTHNINYLLTAGYYKEGTVFPGSFGYKRGTVGFNVSNISADNKFTATLSSSYTFDKNSLGSQDMTTFFNLPANMYTPYDSSGNLRWSEGGFSFGNPFSILRQEYKGTTDRLIANANLSYKLFKKVTLKTNFNYNNVQFDQYSSRPISSQNPAFNPKGSANFNNTSSKTWNIEPMAEFSSALFSKGKLQSIIGGTWQQREDNGILISGSGYTNDVQIKSIAGAATSTVQNDYSLYRYTSFYGRINYNWDDKYLVNFVGRRDASSRFGPGNRLANFGAAGISWIFSKEGFIRNAISFLSYGKIRASYGTTGNDRIGDYQYLDTWTNTTNSYQNQQGLRPTRLFNEHYGWEEIKKLNIGLDLGFIKDRILITVDLYKHRSTNQLISFSLPDQTGFSSIIRNIPAVIENKGIEFLISSHNIKSKSFNWNSSFNLTIPKNELIEFAGLAGSSYASRYFIGKPISNNIVGYSYLGINNQTGIYQFEDKNRDGLLNTLDYAYQGTMNPDFFGGLNNIIQYKQFELSFLFEFRKQLGRHAIFGYSNTPGSFVNQPVAVLDRWQKPGDNATYQLFNQSFGTPASNAASKTSTSSAALTDASFIRLRNLSLSYTIAGSYLEKLKIQNCRIYFQAQNLLTITNYIGADPESQNIQALSPLKMLTFGINATF